MTGKQKQNGVIDGSVSGEEIQRWTAPRKAAAALEIIKGLATAADIARQHDLTVGEVEGWVEKFLEAGREGLRAAPRDQDARYEAEKKDLLAKVGELTLQVDALKKKSSSPSPTSLTNLSGQAPNW